jgi:hypothetical protein
MNRSHQLVVVACGFVFARHMLHAIHIPPYEMSAMTRCIADREVDNNTESQ